MIIIDAGWLSRTVAPPRSPKPNLLPAGARRALLAAEAVSRGELDVKEAASHFGTNGSLIEAWVRALSARRPAGLTGA
jgi:hypothetical protein